MIYINNKEKLDRIKLNKDNFYVVTDFDIMPVAVVDVRTKLVSQRYLTGIYSHTHGFEVCRVRNP